MSLKSAARAIEKGCYEDCDDICEQGVRDVILRNRCKLGEVLRLGDLLLQAAQTKGSSSFRSQTLPHGAIDCSGSVT